ncbi:RING-H2 finger protein ATL73-like [Phragmites australis]|uniref:RING-H2 finger protein ATL73-like n=1 Tax=Phragmites australis TaxID=29695 RepID=UPI002D7A087A|nr:RING-H2 finger protein ATL73-like [Phragmites australis]
MDVERLHARRLLSHGAVATVAAQSPGPAAQVADVSTGTRAAAPLSSLDATVIKILSLLLCGLVVVLAVHVVVRCAFRVMRRVCYGQEPTGGAESAARERASSCQSDPRRKRGTFHGMIPSLVYSPEVELAGCSAAECAICLTEFAQGERVRALPHCNHGFHVRCIDRWLAARQTCPTCRRPPFAGEPALPSDRAGSAGGLQLLVHSDARQPETH